ncbi:ferritin-like domain-containing protein [Actinocorallia sp. API 0066]|uniref:ferritin-like domain-containing protein n=1 Tax=Actinocorallia sp. API 0066 TaxID=2896846 RepID=UPI001E331FA1|nr:ferritin-like domain-containing protein [Actinocorallia sp. API 0066]MCD0453627.1 ferritin-like domain-containing protein [Actinocorallia sp. API 0066]
MSAVPALQAALAAEHRAVYLYGVVGARSPLSAHPRITRIWERHKLRRDQLIAHLKTRDATPVASEPAYPADSAATPAALAAAVESDTLTAYLPLAGAPAKSLRTFAAQAMQEALAQHVRWTRTAPSTPFPALTPDTLTPES